MKKIKVLITAVILSLMMCISAVTVSAQVRKVSDGYILLEDYGMIGNGYYKVCLAPNNFIVHWNCNPTEFCFITNDGVSDNDVLEIIFKYYPDNNLNSSYLEGNERSAYIHDWTYENETYYRISDTTGDEDISEIVNSIMLELNEKNLISAFYKSGEFGPADELYGFNTSLSYSCNNYEKITNYMNENNLDYTLEVCTFNGELFDLILDANTTAKEYFELAVNIYRQTGLVPIFGTDNDFSDYTLFGKNSLEDLQTSTTPVETTPTETTTTTVSTTVTTQPTTTSSSELTTTTTTTTATTIAAPQPTEQAKLLGDADGDNELTVRDCSFIALTIAQGRNDELSDSADYNSDGEVNVRDVANIALTLAKGEIQK